jgi:hypothetical protein
MTAAPVLDAQALRAFYEVLWFPYAAEFLLYELGTEKGRWKLEQREVVLQMPGYPHRHCVFRSTAAVLHTLRELIQAGRPPVNLHFGPVWAAHHLALNGIWPPRKSDVIPEFAPNADLLQPRKFERDERRMTGKGELVLDVDMVGERRIAANCCECQKEKRVCQACWCYFMLPAQRVLTYLVRDFFGFKRCFTVFSGRRGFHMWIMDNRVLDWTLWERRAFLDVLTAPLATDTCDYHNPLCEFVWNTVLANHAAGRTRAATFAALYPVIDAEVATEPGHLHKLPLMLNANSGLFCDILADPDDTLYRFIASPKQLRQLTLAELTPEMLQGCVAHLRLVLSEK